MARNTYYKTAHWQKLRAEAIARDGGRCTVPGCPARGTHVDHIKTRPNVGHPTDKDVLPNLRTLCASHDAQRKEDARGNRKGPGTFVVRGCDADGFPADPNHPWSR